MAEDNDNNQADVVLYEVQGAVALVTMNRPEYHNAQNSQMTYALDAAFRRGCDDDEVKVIVCSSAFRTFKKVFLKPAKLLLVQIARSRQCGQFLE